MTYNYYLAWLHFDTHGRMTTRLAEGHRVLEVLHNSGSNRHPPALWVLVEAVATTPSYTPAAGFPVHVPESFPAEHRQPGPGPVSGPQQRTDYQPQKYYDDPPTDAGQNGGRTQYPELSPETLDQRADDYRNSDSYRSTDNYVPGVPMAPARM